MSLDGIRVVRGVYEAVARRDSEAVLALYDPDFEFDGSRHPYAGVMGDRVIIFRGHDGLQEWWREWLQAWRSYEDKLEELIDAGAHVVSVAVARARGHTSGVDVEMLGNAGLWTVRDGRVVRVVWYATRGDALAAGGAGDRASKVDVVRRTFGPWEHGDFSGVDWVQPDTEFDIADGPESGPWRGLSDIARAWRDVLSPWHGYRAEVELYVALDDRRVLVLWRTLAHGRTSGLDVQGLKSKQATLFDVDQGGVRRLVLYFDADRALAELGL